MRTSKYSLRPEGCCTVNENEEIVANFALHDGKIFCSPEDESEPEYMQFRVHHLGTWHTVGVDLRDPHLLRQLQQQLPTCKVLKASTTARIEAYMAEFVENIQPHPPLYFRQRGFCRLLDGHRVFVAGDEVLGLSEEEKWAISPDIARAHLAYSEGLSCEEAVQKLWTVLDRDGDEVLLVWGFTLISAMRSQLTGLSGSTYPSLMVTGDQGSGKTTVCQRFCLLYGDKQSDMRYWAQRDMRSSPASTIEAVDAYRDQVVLMDDMAKSISPGEVQARKALMAEVLRFASNETNRTKITPDRQTADYFCTAGVAFTSEYDLDNPSDIGRTVAVNITRAMQGGAEIERTYAASAFRYFILWLLPRLDTAISDLRKRMASVSGNYQRLAKNYTMLFWALELFFRFAVDSMAVSVIEENEMLTRSIRICNNLLNQQNKTIEMMSGPQCISWHILSGIQNGTIQSVSEKKLKKGRNLPRYYYIWKEKENMYCIQTNVLYRYLTGETPLRFTSTIAMNKHLVQEGVVQPGEDGKVASVRIRGLRCLGIRHMDLLMAASDVSP